MKRLLLLSAWMGAAIMTTELVAPRRVTPELGGTIGTWTAAITVFLAGLALGNVLGGRWADRCRRSPLPWLLLLAAVGVALGQLLWEGLGDHSASVPHPLLRTWLCVSLAFGPAAVAAGLVAPALGRAALGTGTPPGRALGGLCAAGALGSVAGTLLTGFVLLPRLAVSTVLLGTAGALALSTLLTLGLPWQPRAAALEARAQPGPARLSWVLLAMLSGFAVLVVEMLAARAATLHLGASLFTWTSVLGVVLTGLGLGNVIGGRLADRHAPAPLLGHLLLLASLATASCLWMPALLSWAAAQHLPWALRSLLGASLAYLLPATILGALGPAVLRAALGDPRQDGRTLGRLHAALTIGAVAGAGLTSTALVPLLGTGPVHLLLALALALAAAGLRVRREVPWLVTLVGLLLLGVLPLPAAARLGAALRVRPDADAIAVDESAWFHLRVERHHRRWAPLRDPGRAARAPLPLLLARTAGIDERRGHLTWHGPIDGAQEEALRAWGAAHGEEGAAAELIGRAGHEMRLLSLDGFVHGFSDLVDPTWLEYEYEILCGSLLAALWPSGSQVRSFFIGGGAYTFQRRMRALHGPSAWLVTAEVDPAVTRMAERYLGLVRDAQHLIVHEDARQVLRRPPSGAEGPYDFIFGDAFLDVAVPWHLATVEFAREVRARLAHDGVYVVNLIDAYESGRFLGACVRTLRAVFAHVDVLRPQAHDDRRASTYLVVARDVATPALLLTDDRGRALAVRRYAPAELDALIARTEAEILTDDDAPVEALLAPVLDRR